MAEAGGIGAGGTPGRRAERGGAGPTVCVRTDAPSVRSPACCLTRDFHAFVGWLATGQQSLLGGTSFAGRSRTFTSMGLSLGLVIRR